MKTTLELKQWLVEVVNLKDVQPESIDDNAALCREGLGLDSIDMASVKTRVEKDFGIQVPSGECQRAFASIQALANYLEAHRAG
jgi:acyl carrier protein